MISRLFTGSKETKLKRGVKKRPKKVKVEVEKVTPMIKGRATELYWKAVKLFDGSVKPEETLREYYQRISKKLKLDLKKESGISL